MSPRLGAGIKRHVLNAFAATPTTFLYSAAVVACTDPIRKPSTGESL